jgi:hypothetical protein
MTQPDRTVSLKPGKSRAALTITHPNGADSLCSLSSNAVDRALSPWQPGPP